MGAARIPIYGLTLSWLLRGAWVGVKAYLEGRAETFYQIEGTWLACCPVNSAKLR